MNKEQIENSTIENSPVLTKPQRRAYYQMSDFPKMLVFEENYQKIKDELLNIINTPNYENNFFEPWCEIDLYEESNPDGWKVAPLIINGRKIENRLNRVPFLNNLLSQTKGVITASFSWLKPATWIVPHKGYENYSDKILRCHIGLIIPKGDLGIRVNKIQTRWKEGKGLIFDDSLIHEAWNYSEENRYVLILDFGKDDNLDLNNVVEFSDLLLTTEAKSFVDKK